MVLQTHFCFVFGYHILKWVTKRPLNHEINLAAHISNFLYRQKLWARLVSLFEQQFSYFKHTYTLFHPHVFKKNYKNLISNYSTKHLLQIWVRIKPWLAWNNFHINKPTYFTIQLIFAIIYESYCIFLYYLWVKLYYFS